MTAIHTLLFRLSHSPADSHVFEGWCCVENRRSFRHVIHRGTASLGALFNYFLLASPVAAHSLRFEFVFSNILVHSIVWVKIVYLASSLAIVLI